MHLFHFSTKSQSNTHIYSPIPKTPLNHSQMTLGFTDRLFTARTMHILPPLSQYMGQRFSFFENVFSLRVCSFTVHNAYCSSSDVLNPLSYSTGSLTPVTRQLAIRLSKTKSMQQRGEQKPRVTCCSRGRRRKTEVLSESHHMY
jgi:hypothetical protein